jgi:hypothetical protein
VSIGEKMAAHLKIEKNDLKIDLKNSKIDQWNKVISRMFFPFISIGDYFRLGRFCDATLSPATQNS